MSSPFRCPPFISTALHPSFKIFSPADVIDFTSSGQMPVSTIVSLRLGVIIVASGISSLFIVSIASSLISLHPLVDTITGSKTTYRGLYSFMLEVIAFTISTSFIIPILTARGFMSVITASICAFTYGAGIG